MSQRPKLNRLIASQLPEFIREDYPTFVAFLEAYYEWLGQQDSDLYTLRDIDTTLDRFISYFRNELAPNAILPPEQFARPRHDLAHIKDQHLAKGSEASFKFLFRLLFDKNVTVEYPGRQMLRASDGKWNQDVSIFARVNAGSPDDVVGRIVDVITPNRVIRVLVDRRQDVEVEVDRVVQISPNVYEFYIDRRFFGDISVGDRLRYAGIFDASILATTSKVSIQQKGKNFKVGQLYAIKNGNGSGSVLKVKSVDAVGGIVSAEFVKYGIGYETDFTATLLAQAGQATTGVGQTALNISTISSGVTSIIVNSGGSGTHQPQQLLFLVVVILTQLHLEPYTSLVVLLLRLMFILQVVDIPQSQVLSLLVAAVLAHQPQLLLVKFKTILSMKQQRVSLNKVSLTSLTMRKIHQLFGQR